MELLNHGNTETHVKHEITDIQKFVLNDKKLMKNQKIPNNFKRRKNRKTTGTK